MRATVVAKNRLLLDEAGATFLGSKGYEVVWVESQWKRYPWATHSLTLAIGDKRASAKLASDLASMVREYADFLHAT